MLFDIQSQAQHAVPRPAHRALNWTGHPRLHCVGAAHCTRHIQRAGDLARQRAAVQQTLRNILAPSRTTEGCTCKSYTEQARVGRWCALYRLSTAGLCFCGRWCSGPWHLWEKEKMGHCLNCL